MGEIRGVVLGIDARPAAAGRDQYVRATSDISQSAREAGKAQRELDAAMRAAGAAASELSADEKLAAQAARDAARAAQEQAAAVAQAERELQTYVATLQKQRAGLELTANELTQLAHAEAARAIASRAGIEVDSRTSQAVRDVVASLQARRAELEQLARVEQAAGRIDQYIASLQRERDLLDLSSDQREQYVALLRAEDSARELGVRASDAQLSVILREVTAMQELQAERAKFAQLDAKPGGQRESDRDVDRILDALSRERQAIQLTREERELLQIVERAEQSAASQGVELREGQRIAIALEVTELQRLRTAKEKDQQTSAAAAASIERESQVREREAQAMARAEREAREFIETLQFERRIAGLSNSEREIAIVKREAERRAIQAGVRDVQAYVREAERELRLRQQLANANRGGALNALSGVGQLASVAGVAGSQVAAFAGQVQSGASALDALGLSSRLGQGALFGVAAGIAAVAAGAAGLGYAANESAELERSLVSVSAGARDAAEAYRLLKDAKRDARDVAAASGLDEVAIAPAVRAASNSGYLRDERRAALFASAELQALTEKSNADAFKAVDRVLDAYKRAKTEFPDVAGSLFSAAKQGNNADFLEFAKTVADLGPSANKLKIPLEDVATAVALIAKQGVQAQGSAGALRTLFDTLADSGSPGSKSLGGLGVDGGAVSETGLLRLLAEVKRVSAPEGRKGLLDELFGDRRAGLAAIALLDEAGDKALETRKAIERGYVPLQLAANNLQSAPSLQLARTKEQIDRDIGQVGDGVNDLAARLFGSKALALEDFQSPDMRALFSRLEGAIKSGRAQAAEGIASELASVVDDALAQALEKSSVRDPDFARDLQRQIVREAQAGRYLGSRLAEYSPKGPGGLTEDTEAGARIAKQLQAAYTASLDPLEKTNDVLRLIQTTATGSGDAIARFERDASGKIRAVLQEIKQPEPIELTLDARKLKLSLEDALGDVTSELKRGAADPLQFDVAIALEAKPEKIREAYARVKGLVENTDRLAYPTPLSASEQDDVDTLRQYATELDAVNDKNRAAAQALAEFESKLRFQAEAAGKSGRALRDLEVTQEANRLLAAANGAATAEAAKQYRDLALAAYDANEAEQRRARAAAASLEGGKAYDDIVADLREQIRLQGRSSDQVEADNILQRARAALLAEAAGKGAALAAAIAGVPFDVQFAPVDGRSVDDVRELVRQLQFARAAALDLNDVSNLGPLGGPDGFVPPDRPTPLLPEEQIQGREALARYLDDLNFEKSLLALTTDERERAIYLRQVEYAAMDAGEEDRAKVLDFYGREFDELQRLRKFDNFTINVGRQLADDLEAAVFEGRELNDVLRGLSRLAFRSFVTDPLAGVFQQGAKSFFGGLFGGPGGTSAKGNAWSSGTLQAFALGAPFSGGHVTNGPEVFPFAGGRKLGLRGEAGDEGVLPLRRGPDGRLGVIAHGGAGSNSPQTVDQRQTFHVTQKFYGQQDTNGMKKASRHIAADAQRVMRRGRN